MLSLISVKTTLLIKERREIYLSSFICSDECSVEDAKCMQKNGLSCWRLCFLQHLVLYICACLKKECCLLMYPYEKHSVRIFAQNSFKKFELFVFVRVPFRSSSFCASVKVQSSSREGG